jgi:hypothetical protein
MTEPNDPNAVELLKQASQRATARLDRLDWRPSRAHYEGLRNEINTAIRSLEAATATRSPVAGKASELADTVPDQIERVMSSKWLDPECGEDGCQSLRWKNLYDQAVKGRQDFRRAYRDALRRPPAITEEAVEAIVSAGLQMIADYQTSEQHHPRHVLVPLTAFDSLRAAIAALSASPVTTPENPGADRNAVLFDRMAYFVGCIAHADREGWNDATIDEARLIEAALKTPAPVAGDGGEE